MACSVQVARVAPARRRVAPHVAPIVSVFVALFATSALADSSADSAAATEQPQSTAAAGSRVLHFPPDRSLGTLTVNLCRDSLPHRLAPDYRPTPRWQYLADARGDVVVPPDVPVKLEATPAALRDMSPLSQLGPHDLHTLELWVPEGSGFDFDNDLTPHLTALKGLNCLKLFNGRLTGIADKHGISLINVLGGVISSEGLIHFQGLKALSYLNIISNDDISEAALARLRAELPRLRTLRINNEDRMPGING